MLLTTILILFLTVNVVMTTTTILVTGIKNLWSKYTLILSLVTTFLLCIAVPVLLLIHFSVLIVATGTVPAY